MSYRSSSYETYDAPYEFTREEAPIEMGRPRIQFRSKLILSGFAATIVLGAGITAFMTFSGMREDIISNADAERSRIELSYRQRIDKLRAEIDRLTSRQALDRETLDQQVSQLLQRQSTLRARQSLVSDLIERAERSGLPLASDSPLPARKPDFANAYQSDDGSKPGIGGEAQPIDNPFEALGLRGSSSLNPAQKPVAPQAAIPAAEAEKQAALSKIRSSLSHMDQQSHAALDAITRAADKETRIILAQTGPLGLTLDNARQIAGPDHLQEEGVGGPYEPYLDPGFTFRAAKAENALEQLDLIKNASRKLPLGRPTHEARISSTFGPRMDPFLGKLAMHTGIDFAVTYGTKIISPGPGKVISAGWHGGYGKMVEVRHSNGLVSRFAHMSRILVSVGDKVETGDLIGKVGSTGRSTGPHLHYELRRNGKAIDPMPYVKAGENLQRWLDT